jgi:pimeloyl-ACP methyl ester carboxylesterase
MQITQTTYSIDYNGQILPIAAKFRKSGTEMLFFIHGLGCSQETFDGVWSFRMLDRYSVLTCDLPGFGDSPGCDDFSYDLYDTAELCRGLLALLPGYRIHIIGHSMGGAIGMLLSEMIEGRLASFINVEGNLIGQDCSISSRRLSVSFEEYEKKRLPELLLFSGMSVEPGRRLWSRLMRKADVKALYRSSRSLVEWSDSGRLFDMFLKLDRKKIYIYGEADSFMGILKMLDGVSLVKISKSGHFPMIDNPGEFYGALAAFLESVPFPIP